LKKIMFVKTGMVQWLWYMIIIMSSYGVISPCRFVNASPTSLIKQD
jgi:hypothetical protein